MPSLHATCVSIGGRGVLLRGPSGGGKSDLALRLIDRGARLVADDQVALRAAEGVLRASAPEAIAGMIEVRGIGILALEPVADIPVVLVVDLVEADAVERLPEPETVEIQGVAVPVARLWAFAESAPIKVELAVGLVNGDIRTVER